jgi:hypothetical protein
VKRGEYEKSAKILLLALQIAVLHLLAKRRRPASPLSAGIDVAPITDSIWRDVAHRDSLFCPELAYKFGSTDRKRKYGKIKMKSK